MLETGKDQLEMSWLGQPRICSVWEHRTVRWCTGQCPVRQAGSCELAVLGISSAAYGYNSPDCPVCTGLSGELTDGRTNGRLRDSRETRGRANGREGHQTVRWPKLSELQRSKLKGKCALGPFLSILVIECQRKCFCVDLCNEVDKVQIISKGIFLRLSTLF